MGCLKMFLLFLLIVSGLLSQLPESSVSEQSDSSLQEAIIAAKAQGFEANNLFAYISEGCSLPCWNNVTVGESSEELFLANIRDLEFNLGSINATEENEYEEQWRFVNSIFIPTTGDDLKFSFSVYATFNDDILQMLELNWVSYGIIEMLPEVVIEQLGTPDEVYVAYDAVRGRVLWLEYEELHTDFIYSSFMPFKAPPFEICTDTVSWRNPNSVLVAFISSPAYPEVRLPHIEHFIPSQYYKIYNLTEVSSYTAESFANDVVNNSETCLTLDEAFVSGIEE